MVQIPFQTIVSEMKDRPTTMVTLLALCAFSIWGYAKFALASDVEVIRTEVRKEISSVTIAVTANARSIDRVLKLQIAEAIRGQQRAMCASSNETYRENVQILIDQLQEDYKELDDNGTAYPVSSCS